jgi:hypothetical protein
LEECPQLKPFAAALTDAEKKLTIVQSYSIPGISIFLKRDDWGMVMLLPPRFKIYNKSKMLLPAAALVLILVVWGAVSLFAGPGLAPEELFNRSLQNTLASHSYRYAVEVKQNGRDVISTVRGERVEPDRVHIKGSMLKSKDIEFIQITDTTYMKDPWSGRWITLQGSMLAQAELFLTEFNPLALFDFKDVPEITYGGREKVDGVKTELLQLKPMVANPYLEFKYVDYDYKLWVDPKEQLIRRAVMEAKQTGGENGMLVEMKFWDFNEPIVIEKPGLEVGS